MFIDDVIITKTVKSVKRAMNLTDKELEVARDRGLSTDELLAYDIVPSPILFDEDGFMTKPDKSSLIRELEEHLTKEDYSFNHEPNAAYLIDVMASYERCVFLT